MFLMFGLVGVFPWEIDKSAQSLELEMAGDMTLFGARSERLRQHRVARQSSGVAPMRETPNLEVDFVRASSESCATRAADASYRSRRARFENRELGEGGSERGLARPPKLLSGSVPCCSAGWAAEPESREVSGSTAVRPAEPR